MTAYSLTTKQSPKAWALLQTVDKYMTPSQLSVFTQSSMPFTHPPWREGLSVIVFPERSKATLMSQNSSPSQSTLKELLIYLFLFKCAMLTTANTTSEVPNNKMEGYILSYASAPLNDKKLQRGVKEP